MKENIEKLFEENGLQPISCPRPSSKRGGGCAVIVNLKKFTVEKLSVRRLKRFLWQVFIPRLTTEKNSILLQHLIEQMQLLLIKYPKAGYLYAGAKNKMDTKALEDALPKCKQIVTKYT